MSKYFRKYNRKKFMILFVFFLLFFSVLNISTVADDDLRPDLTIVDLDCPNVVVEGDVLKVNTEIKNIGDEDISAGTTIEVGLYIDGILVSTNNTDEGLPVGNSSFVNLSWTANLGDQTKRLLRVMVDYRDIILESDENNNVRDKFIDVLERGTELDVVDIYFSGTPRVNETVDVYVDVTNNGMGTDESIYAKLSTSGEGEIETISKDDGLSKGETYTYVFEWSPDYFGSQTLKVEVYIHEGEVHDTNEITVFVDVAQLQWWNSSWHYRNFTVVQGAGNVSVPMNFTQLLRSLNVFSAEFENETIRIIEYRTDGGIVEDGEVEIFRFIESAGYDSETNATGTLLWRVTGSPDEKYYCIYFDVEDNPGDRMGVPEAPGMMASGDAHRNFSGFVEGWWAAIDHPANGSYCLISESIEVSVRTMAKAEYVIAYISWDADETHSFTLYLVDQGNETNWTYENFYFDREGNWTIRVESRDKAGYESPVMEQGFYVGKPDLEVLNISFATDWSATSPVIYKGDMVTITAHVVSYKANVYDVTVNLSIFDIDNNLTVYTAINISVTILKDKDNLVSFNWEADQTGDYNITIIVDPDDEVDELNESNNQLTKSVTVYGWPDLAVEGVSVPMKSVMEGKRARVDAVIANYGEGNANNYQVGLCFEEVEENSMSYSNIVNTTLVSVKTNASEQISLFWEIPATGEWIGEWMVGVKVIVNDSKRDKNIVNNQNMSFDTLKVRSRDRNDPKISDIKVLTSNSFEQGVVVTITAKVTDDSGLEYVIIKITDPVNKSYGGDMIRTGGDMFSFVFEDTLEVGLYRFIIEAVDISIYENEDSKSGSFNITKDTTSPVISYFDAHPFVQLKGDKVDITCIATDNVGIKTVEVIIIYPHGDSEAETMGWSSKGKYVYSQVYDTAGKHSFYIRVEDKAGNIVETGDKIFWITQDIDDRDNDGMPDWWEEKYDLNPENPVDADLDMDGDGYTNVKEYEIGTNPMKDIFMQNVAYRVRDNIWYIFGSLVLFIIVVLLSFYGKKRRKSL